MGYSPQARRYCPNCGLRIELEYRYLKKHKNKRVLCQRCGMHIRIEKLCRIPFIPRRVYINCGKDGEWKKRVSRCFEEIGDEVYVVLSAFNLQPIMHLLKYLNRHRDLHIHSMDTEYSNRKHCAEMIVRVSQTHGRSVV